MSNRLDQSKVSAFLRQVADDQYWAEVAYIDATIPLDAPTWALPKRIEALDAAYRDLLERI